jgi:hypothetical protein
MPNYLACVACGGTYADVCHDGMRYFHACPPVTVVTVSRAGVVTDVSIHAVKPTDLVTVTRAGVVQLVPASAVLVDDIPAPVKFAPRVGARDENIASVDASGVAQIKSAGAGVVPAPPPPAIVPIDVSVAAAQPIDNPADLGG